MDRRGDSGQAGDSGRAAIPTLVAAVLKLGVVVVLVSNDDGDLADPDQRFVALVRGGDGQREFPLTLSVKVHRRGDVTWRERITTATVTNRDRQLRGVVSPRVWSITSIGVDVKPRRDAVSMHDPVLDLSVHAHVCVLGLDAQDVRPRGLVFQNHGVLAVVETLWRVSDVRAGGNHGNPTLPVGSLTSWKTGLLLLTSLIPTTTWVELLSGNGPPDALSSVAVMLSTYWGPLSLGGGLLLSLMMPAHKHQQAASQPGGQ